MTTSSDKQQQFFESLLILYADSNAHTANSMVSQFKSVGLKNVISLRRPEEWEQSLTNRSIFPDMIIIDQNFFGAESADRIRTIRRGELSANPFIPIIGTVGEAKQSEIMPFIRSGIDEILIRPVAVKTVVQRLNNFSRGRKPFIATMDYIGPDRRTREERTATTDTKDTTAERLVDPRPVDVPNSLQLKVERAYTVDSFLKSLSETQKRISHEVLRGAVFQLIFNSMIVRESASYRLSDQKVAEHADSILDNIDLVAEMAQKSSLIDGHFMRSLDDTRDTYLSGTSQEGFDPATSTKLIDTATKLALVVYQQNSPHRIMTEIRDSAQKYMNKFY